MALWEAIHDIPQILPVLATLTGAVVVTIFFLVNIFNRARLVEQIKKTELELKRVREGPRAGQGFVEKPSNTVIVKIHDHLLKCRQDLRRTKDRARISGFILLPLLAGGVFGIGHMMRTIEDLEYFEQMTARFQNLEHEFKNSVLKTQAIEEEFVIQESEKAQMAKEAEEYAHEKDTLQARLTKTEQLLATEKKERIELEVLLGQAEQRLARLEHSHNPKKEEAETFMPGEETLSPPETITEPDSTQGVSRERSFEETDLYADSRKLSAVNTPSHYTGKLKGQIAFEATQRQSMAPLSEHHIYVLVRWGLSSWIVTDSLPRVNSNGSVEAEFKVILPIGTVRTLDVTAIATDKAYRRYQHVRFPDYKWKASSATIAVDRS
jgi:hypothetical protein